jgi:hypothetical protein
MPWERIENNSYPLDFTSTPWYLINEDVENNR